MKAIIVGFLFVLVLGFVTGCDGGTYEPPFVPIIFRIDSSGNITWEGTTTMVTPIGRISLGKVAPSPSAGEIVVTIRDTRRALSDDVYVVKGGKGRFVAVTDGETRIEIEQGRVLIDITKGNVKFIRLERDSAAP
jgi:hypothetical protein